MLLIAPGSTDATVDPEKMPALCYCAGTADDVAYISNVSESQNYAGLGVQTKLIEIEGYNHLDMISKEYNSKKNDCFDFLNK